MGFDDIYYQDIAVNIIKNGLKNDRLSQSLLFYGQPYSGKLTTAIFLAKALNCLNFDGDNFCDNCKSCNKIDKFLHPDVFIVDSDNYFQKFHQLVSFFNIMDFKTLKYHLNLNISRFYYRTATEHFPLKKAKDKWSKSEISEILEEYQILINNSPSMKELNQLISEKVDLDDLKKLNQKDEKATKKGKKRTSEKSKMSFLEYISSIESLMNLENIPIETIKNIMEKMNLSVTEGKRKVFIFNGIEYMRVEGSNAFLKSIEEPPKNSQIILITSNIDKIIQTIKSRCYQIEFKKRTINDLYNVYSKVYNTNFFNISIEKQNELFKSHSDMIYKEYFILIVDFLHNIERNKNLKYKKLFEITKFSNTASSILEKSSKKNALILKQVIIDILNIIKIKKKSYEYEDYLNKLSSFFTDEEKTSIKNKLNSTLEKYVKFSVNIIEENYQKLIESFDLVMNNNVDVEMALTSYFLEFVD